MPVSALRARWSVRLWTRLPRRGGCRQPSPSTMAPSFTSLALDDWAHRRAIKLDFTRPGKPTDNGLIESFNSRLRDEYLNAHEFASMDHAHERLRAWQVDYNRG